MEPYPYQFEPIYKPTIWGGRNLQRLFSRPLPPDETIGESWELADLPRETSVVRNGPARGKNLSELTAELGEKLLGGSRLAQGGRFPLLLKFLDANDTLSLQVHPDEAAAASEGGQAAFKTECWYIVESRGGFLYKGLQRGVTPDMLERLAQSQAVVSLVQKYNVQTGDFHFVPAGTVHALGAGLVVAEVQTPSDTTYRVTDWGRGRELHLDQSLRSIHFAHADDAAPGAGGAYLLRTPHFDVQRLELAASQSRPVPQGLCTALMILAGSATLTHAGKVEPSISLRGGDTVLLPAALKGASMTSADACTWLQITLPG